MTSNQYYCGMVANLCLSIAESQREAKRLRAAIREAADELEHGETRGWVLAGLNEALGGKSDGSRR